MSQKDRTVALVTGASRGVGEATVRELARRGFAVAIAARSVDALNSLADQLSSPDCPILVVPTDLRNPDEIRRLVDLTLAKFGHIDVLINNAGVIRPGVVVARMPHEDIGITIGTNLLGPIELTRLILPSMLERNRGTIIFVESIGGHVSWPSLSLYSTAKSGLRAFALALRREVASSGVSVCLVAPGFIRTEMAESARHLLPPGLYHVMVRPELIARAIVAAIERPKREVVVPGYYRLFIMLEHVCPWLIDHVAYLYIRQILAKQRLV